MIHVDLELEVPVRIIDIVADTVTAGHHCPLTPLQLRELIGRGRCSPCAARLTSLSGSMYAVPDLGHPVAIDEIYCKTIDKDPARGPS